MSSRDVFCRMVKGTIENPEIAQALQWLGAARAKTNFDPDVMTYPATTLMCAFVKSTGEALLYMPVQNVFMLDGLGPNPLASPEEVAQGIAEIVKVCHFEAAAKGMGELYFPTSDMGIVSFAERHNFIRMTYEVPQVQEGAVPKLVDMPFLKMKLRP